MSTDREAKAIFAEGELSEAGTCKDSLQVRREGNREFTLRRDSLARALPEERKAKKGQGGAR